MSHQGFQEPRSRRSPFGVALVAGLAGWGIFGFFGLLLLFVGQEENCTARRAEAYRDCVRNSDLTGLRIQSFVMGLAMLGFTVAVIAAVRGHAPNHSDPKERSALLVSGSLVVASIGGWVLGASRFWAPERPFPYDPISTGQGNTTMLIGGLVGLVVGTAVGLAMTRPT